MHRQVKFEKYHGLGNDFIIINIDDLIKEGIEESSFSTVVEKICDRHTGIGADGCIVLKKITEQKCEMIFFNQDGTRATMCGNGIRCFAHYIFNNEILKGKIYKILTGSGELEVEIYVNKEKKFKCKVNMGKPIYDISSIPLDSNELKRIKEIDYTGKVENVNYQTNNFTDKEEGESVDYILEVDENRIILDSLFMGTTHGVAFIDSLDKFPIEKIGPQIETNKLFPKKTNVNFVELLDRENIKMKTWERGAGLTFACGTGASASVVVGALKYGVLEKKVTVHLPKGVLEIEVTESRDVFMTGPSEKIGKGEYIYERN